MFSEGVNHFSIRTVKLEQTRSFYEDVLGFKAGERPDFDFPGYWLYQNGHALVHLVGVDPDDTQGLADYLGDLDADGLKGSGALDHLAFSVSDPEALLGALSAHDVAYRERKVPDLDLFQIFVEDPNGVTLEFNCFGAGGASPFEQADDPALSAPSAPPRSAPKPTREDMLDRARSLNRALRDRAAEAERLGRLPEATMAELHDAGLWRVGQPARWGGGEFDYALMIEVAAELGRACGSTGWVHINLASHYWMIAMWPEEAQRAVWGADPAAMAASSLIYPAGRARTVKGGFELSGRWSFCSGIHHSDWMILGGMVAARNGAQPKPHLFLAPKSALKPIDTWDVLGLVGTGSIDVEGDAIFVPAHMALDAEAIKGGPTPGSAVNPSPLYRLPVWALLPHVIGAPIIGMAKGIYDVCVEATAERVSTFNASKVAEHATTQLRIAEAGAAADAARALLVDNCREATRIAEAGETPSSEAKYRWRRDGAYGTNLAGDSGAQLYRNAGGAGIFATNPLQRRFRDMNAGLAHIGVSMAVNGVGHGRVALGLEPDNPIV